METALKGTTITEVLKDGYNAVNLTKGETFAVKVNIDVEDNKKDDVFVKITDRKTGKELCFLVVKENSELKISVFESDYEQGVHDKTIEEIHALDALGRSLKTLKTFLK